MGCARWQTTTQPPVEVLASQPDRLLVTHRDSGAVILTRPIIRDSAIVGFRTSARGRVDTTAAVTVPLSQAEKLAVWYPGSPNLYYGVGIGAGVLLIGAIVVCAASGC